MEKVMVSDVPYMLEQWDAEKNIEIPVQVSAKNKTTKYHWKCIKCGCEWMATPCARFRTGGKCPCCDSNKVIKKGVNDVLTLVSGLAEMYDFEKNTEIDIYSQGVDSGLYAYWKCNECGRSWKTMIKARIKKVDGKYVAVKCPHYDTRKRKSHEVQRVSEVPQLMEFWDFEENTLDPVVTPSNSQQRAAWRCKGCGYKWERAINARMQSLHKCPCCELNAVIRKGVNDLFTIVPEAKKSYAFDKNEGIDIYSLGTRSSVLLWWRCEKCGHEWQASIATRIKGKKGAYGWSRCQQCYFRDVNRITPVSSIPKLMRFWDEEKNSGLGMDANTVSAYSNQKAQWKCKDCGYEWSGSIKGRYGAPDECPHCEGGRGVITGENDVLTLAPELARVYDFELNKGIDLSLLGINSSKVAYFRCKKCGRRWKSSILKQVKKNEDGSLRVVGCAMCDNSARRKMTYAEQYPELDLLFNEELNGCTLASVKSADTTKIKYWWDCMICGRTFQSRVQSMIVAQGTKTKGCPYCSNSILIEGGSFAELHPELMDEYSPENEVDAFKVFPNHKGVVKWVCRNDPSHVWEASFVARHKGGGNCPVCDGARVVKGVNSFADIYKEFVSWWAPSNARGADETLYDSCLWIRWICPNCNGEYGAYIRDVVSEEESCPYCKNRMNSFAAKHEKLMNEWDWLNNYLLADPNQIGENSKIPVWWICSKNNAHRYIMSPRQRVWFQKRHRESCPYCKGLRRKKRHFI